MLQNQAVHADKQTAIKDDTFHKLLPLQIVGLHYHLGERLIVVFCFHKNLQLCFCFMLITEDT
jgi:hypothetical protein